MTTETEKHQTATEMIESAIQVLDGASEYMHLVYSSSAYTVVSVCHSLRAISGTEFRQYCERITQIDARWIDNPGPRFLP
ncbi:MAG TPA: hypothetical protein VNV36_05335 [Pseudomonas sp.]|uniref:hypothetical protein n=1 Tax=Pseudomonas sp. TaxID=306 RepID=UPI002D1AED52|nr:hypothetical protein [Pseudomonas sp.]HWH86185.1 hypothetical protein [Pseudomonas sp.]